MNYIEFILPWFFYIFTIFNILLLVKYIFKAENLKSTEKQKEKE